MTGPGIFNMTPPPFIAVIAVYGDHIHVIGPRTKCLYAEFRELSGNLKKHTNPLNPPNFENETPHPRAGFRSFFAPLTRSPAASKIKPPRPNPSRSHHISTLSSSPFAA